MFVYIRISLLVFSHINKGMEGRSEMIAHVVLLFIATRNSTPGNVSIPIVPIILEPGGQDASTSTPAPARNDVQVEPTLGKASKTSWVPTAKE